MSSRTPAVIDQKTGKIISQRGNTMLAVLTQPETVGHGGLALGWLENWQLRQHNKSLSAYAGYLSTLVTIAKYEAQLQIITNRENIKNQVDIAGQRLVLELQELIIKTTENRELEEIEIEKRAMSLELVKAQRESYRIEIEVNSRPVEDRVRDVILHFNKIIGDAKNDDSLSMNERDSLCDQFEALRDVQLIELTGRPMQESKPRDKSPQAKTEVEKNQECALLWARCDMDCALTRNDAALDDHQKARNISALKTECERRCKEIKYS